MADILRIRKTEDSLLSAMIYDGGSPSKFTRHPLDDRRLVDIDVFHVAYRANNVGLGRDPLQIAVDKMNSDNENPGCDDEFASSGSSSQAEVPKSADESSPQIPASPKDAEEKAGTMQVSEGQDAMSLLSSAQDEVISSGNRSENFFSSSEEEDVILGEVQPVKAPPSPKKRGRRKRCDEDNSMVYSIVGLADITNDMIVANMDEAYAIALRLLEPTVGASWAHDNGCAAIDCSSIAPGYMGTKITKEEFRHFVCFVAARLHKNMRDPPSTFNCPCNVYDKKFLPHEYFSHCKDNNMNCTYPNNLVTAFMTKHVVQKLSQKEERAKTDAPNAKFARRFSDTGVPEHHLVEMVYAIATAANLKVERGHIYDARNSVKPFAICSITGDIIRHGDVCARVTYSRRTHATKNSPSEPGAFYLHASGLDVEHDDSLVNTMMSFYSFLTIDKVIRHQLQGWKEKIPQIRVVGVQSYLNELFVKKEGILFIAKMFAYLQNLLLHITVTTIKACTIDPVMALEESPGPSSATSSPEMSEEESVPPEEPMPLPEESPICADESEESDEIFTMESASEESEEPAVPEEPPKKKISRKSKRSKKRAVPTTDHDLTSNAPDYATSHTHFELDTTGSSLFYALLALRQTTHVAFGEYFLGSHGGRALMDTKAGSRLEPFKTFDKVRKIYEKCLRKPMLGAISGKKRKRALVEDPQKLPHLLLDFVEAISEAGCFSLMFDASRVPVGTDGKPPAQDSMLISLTIAMAKILMRPMATENGSSTTGLPKEKDALEILMLGSYGVPAITDALFADGITKESLARADSTIHAIMDAKIKREDYMAKSLCFWIHKLCSSQPSLIDHFEKKLRGISHPSDLIGGASGFGLHLVAYMLNLFTDLVMTSSVCDSEEISNDMDTLGAWMC